MPPTTHTLRPLSCWKSILRRTRLQKAATRQLTTYYQPQADYTPPPEPIRLQKPAKQEPSRFDPNANSRRKIRVVGAPPPLKFKEPIKDVTATQLAILDPTGARAHLFSKTNPEAVHVGDILLVRLKTGDPFAGVCINIRRRGVDSSILLRNELTRVGVEMYYKIYSPNVEGIEVVQRALKRARRARLTYMRKPKHDIGSVQNIVLAYQKSRGALMGSGKGTLAKGELKGGKRKVKVRGKAKSKAKAKK